jgi:putative transposase
MPDHVHFFARSATDAKPLPAWIKSWKSIFSRQLGSGLQTPGPVWQPDYFDHFVRSVAAYQEKWQYVQDNPLRKGLCKDRVAWPYQGTLHDLKFEQAG